MSQQALVINLGGEGEIPGIINQQGPWCVSPGWRSSRTGKTFQQLVNDGHVFLICPNLALPFPDDTVALVYTESVPIDIPSTYGPGVQSSEIKRILKPGGQWFKDGNLEWTKP